MKLVVKMIKNIKSALELTKKFVLSKKSAAFYLILLLVQIPFVIQWLNILPLFLVGNLISPDINLLGMSLSLIVYLTIPVSLAFFVLNVLVIGSIISSVFSFGVDKKDSIFQSFKNAIKKFKKLFLASFLIILLNFLILTPSLIYVLSQEPSYKPLTSELQNLLPPTELEQINRPLIYGIPLLDSLSRFGKPIIPISNEAVDLCIITGLSCIPSILFNAFNLSSVFVLLISLIFIFIFQEIILTEQSLKESIKKSFEYFKNNFVEIALVWLISAFIFIIGNLFITLVGYLIPIIPAYLGYVFAFLLVIVFQTSYYLNFIKK